MKDKIKEKIEEAHSIVLLSHVNQDVDALGSCFAMREVLRGLGKNAVCCIDEMPEKRIDFFGDDYILAEDAQKEYDLALVLDCGSIDRLGNRIAVYNSAKQHASVDHHGTNTFFADYNYVEPDASATGEILFYLLKEWNYKINDMAAMYLYCAIAADSGCFKYSCVSKRTMLAVAGLIDYKFDHSYVCLRLFDTFNKNVIKLHGYIMNNVRSYANGKISVVSVDEDILKQYGVDEKDAGNIVNIPRSVEGTVIAVELKRRNGKIRVSLRANEDIDVSVVAVALGGGGHARAAGAAIDAPTIEEAEQLIVDMLIKNCISSGENKNG